MHISNELRVGIMFLTGLILLALIIVSFTNWGEDRNTYAFTIRFLQAQGVQEGAPVRVAGVKVGMVSAVGLEPGTNQALVVVRVKRDVVIYRNYSFLIGVGGLVGERYIEIMPVPSERGEIIRAGAEVRGATTPDMNELMVQASELVQSLTETTDSMNRFIGDRDTQARLKSAIADLEATMASTAQFSAGLNDMLGRNEQSIDLFVANLSHISDELRHMSDVITPQVEHTQVFANLDVVSADLVAFSKRLNAMATSLDGLVNDPEVIANIRGVSTNLRTASEDLNAIMTQAKTASADLPAITQSLRQVADDLPAITGPLKDVAPDTAKNVHEISSKLRLASDDIGVISRTVAKTSTALSNTKIESHGRLMMLPENGHVGLRSDFNADLIGENTKFRVGVAALEDGGKMNLQFGNRLHGDSWFRYGVIQSRYGVGFDRKINENTLFSAELFDPEEPKLNALVDLRFPPLGTDWWVTTGFYHLMSGGNLGVGFTYRP
jgi:phospholipid/cholesterol/gamma-HCH transport system substrate-binding protein